MVWHGGMCQSEVVVRHDTSCVTTHGRHKTCMCTHAPLMDNDRSSNQTRQQQHIAVLNFISLTAKQDIHL